MGELSPAVTTAGPVFCVTMSACAIMFTMAQSLLLLWITSAVTAELIVAQFSRGPGTAPDGTLKVITMVSVWPTTMTG